MYHTQLIAYDKGSINPIKLNRVKRNKYCTMSHLIASRYYC